MCSWLVAPVSAADSSRVSQETAAQEQASDTCQGAGDTKLQAQLTCYSAPVGFGFYIPPSGVICCFLPAYGEEICVELPRT